MKKLLLLISSFLILGVTSSVAFANEDKDHKPGQMKERMEKKHEKIDHKMEGKHEKMHHKMEGKHEEIHHKIKEKRENKK
jgi:hypothetical protein